MQRSGASYLHVCHLGKIIPKDVQYISNIKGTNVKYPWNPKTLITIKGRCNYIYNIIFT